MTLNPLPSRRPEGTERTPLVGLTYELSVRCDVAQQPDEVVARWRGGPLDPKAHPQRTIRVTQQNATLRLDFQDGEAGVPNTSVILPGDNRPALWLDHAARTCLTLREPRSGARPQAAKILQASIVATDQHRTLAGRRVAEWVVHYADLGIAQHLWLCADADLTPHRPGLARAVLGDTLLAARVPSERSQTLRAAVLKAGAVLGLEVRTRQGVPLGTILEVQGLRVARLPATWWQAPRDYADPSKTGEKPWAHHAPTTTISERVAFHSESAGTSSEKTRSTNWTGEVDVPSCLEATRDSRVSVDIEYPVLQAARSLVNLVSRRLTEFSATGHSLPLDWFDQMEDHAEALAGAEGSGLFHLLHDAAGGQRGLLDRLAAHLARNALESGDPFSVASALGLTVDTLNALAAALALPADERWESLPAPARAEFVEAVLRGYLGRPVIDLASKTDADEDGVPDAEEDADGDGQPDGEVWEQPFHLFGEDSAWHDVVLARIDDIDFTIGIDNTEIVQGLTFTADGAIRADVTIPRVHAEAHVFLIPGSGYWTATIATSIACAVFGGWYCTLSSVLWTVLLLGTNWGQGWTLEIDAQNVGLTVTCRPALVDHQVRPTWDLTLDAEFDLSMTGATMPLTWLFSLLVSAIPERIQALQDLALDSINDAIEERTEAAGLDLPGIPEELAAADAENFQVWSEATNIDNGLLVTGGNLFFHLDVEGFTSDYRPLLVPTEPDFRLLGARETLGTGPAPHRVALTVGLSQNVLNRRLLALWQQGEFRVTAAAPAELVALAEPPLPVAIDALVAVEIWAAAPPYLQLAATATVLDDVPPMAITTFGDVRVCIRTRMGTLELAFAARVPTAIGFGTRLDSTDHLNFVGPSDTVFDVYFHEVGLVVDPIAVQDVNLAGYPLTRQDRAAIAGWQGLFAEAVRILVATRTAAVVPATEKADADEPFDLSSVYLWPGLLELKTLYQLRRQVLYTSAVLGGVVVDMLDSGALDDMTAEGAVGLLDLMEPMFPEG